MTKIPTLQEYYDMLEKHDWYYEFSDDSFVYFKGKSNRDELLRISQKEPLFPKAFRLFQSYQIHMFSGPPWGTEKAPKPERPSE